MKGKKRYINLNDQERSALIEGQKRGKKATFRQRCHYILLSDQGKTVPEISDIYQVRYQSILKWFNRFEDSGISALHTAKGRGIQPIIRIDNEPQIKRIEELVEQNAQNLKPVLAAIEK